jgi:Spy/CpxP family protein refolding chaperone
MAAKHCGAKTKSGGECKNWAMPNGRCRLHGGKTPKGIASPHWKTGRYSKYLPTNLFERYSSFISDPEVLSLNAEIAITDTRLSQLLEKITTGDSQDIWAEIENQFNKFDEYQKLASSSFENETARRSYIAKSFDALSAIRSIVKDKQKEWRTWREITELIDARRKLVDSEAKRRIQMEQMLTAEQAIQYASALGLAVKEHVTDREVLEKIQETLNRIIGGNYVKDNAG